MTSNIDNEIKPQLILRIATHFDNHIFSEIVDRTAFTSLDFIVTFGSILGQGSIYTPGMIHGDTPDLSDGEIVPESDIIGSIEDATFKQGEPLKSSLLGYAGNKRFVRYEFEAVGENLQAQICAFSIGNT